MSILRYVYYIDFSDGFDRINEQFYRSVVYSDEREHSEFIDIGGEG